MASPHISSSRHSALSSRTYRRSSFNGAKQLAAAGAATRRTLAVVGLLVVALVVALGVVAFQLWGGTRQRVTYDLAGYLCRQQLLALGGVRPAAHGHELASARAAHARRFAWKAEGARTSRAQLFPLPSAHTTCIGVCGLTPSQEQPCAVLGLLLALLLVMALAALLTGWPVSPYLTLSTGLGLWLGLLFYLGLGQLPALPQGFFTAGCLASALRA